MPPISQTDLEHVLQHTQEVWEQARGSRIFLAGGTGFFGCWLVESLAFANRELSLGIEATILTRDPNSFLRKCPHLAEDRSIHLQEGDVRSLACRGERYDAVIHAATESSARQAPLAPHEMYTTMLEGTQRALEFASRCRARQFLFTSSGAVYGTQPPELAHVPEEYLGGPDCTDAVSAYAEGKRAAEMMTVLQAGADLEVKIARCFAFVGPHLPLDAHFAIGNFIRDAMRGGPVVVAGDGTPMRSYLYAADLAIWLWVILFQGAPGRAYNVGSEDTITIAELARAVAEMIDPAMQVVIKQHRHLLEPLRQYVPSTRRARQELGLMEHIPLSGAIRRTVRWHREHG